MGKERIERRSARETQVVHFIKPSLLLKVKKEEILTTFAIRLNYICEEKSASSFPCGAFRLILTGAANLVLQRLRKSFLVQLPSNYQCNSTVLTLHGVAVITRENC